MNQKRRTKSDSFRHNEQGVALIYALVVMAVIFALALALLYGVGQVSLMTSSNREQEDCYFQALTLSEIVGMELTSATNTGGGIYKAAVDYMPGCDSESVEESMQFSAKGLSSDYGTTVIRFQNGVNAATEPHYWQSKELSNQYLDLTVEVWGKKGGKESVTSRYNFYQLLDDEDMKYTLKTNQYTGDMKQYDCKYVPADGINGEHFEVYENGVVMAEPLKFQTQIVTMEMAEQWAGEEQDAGMQEITIQEGKTNINVYVQLKDHL